MQNNKEHIWNVQSLPVFVSVRKASLTGALSHWHSVSAGTDKSTFIPHLNLPHFIKQHFIGYLQLLSRPRFYRKNVPTHDEDLVLKYRHSFFRILSFSSCKECELFICVMWQCLFTTDKGTDSNMGI